MKRPTCLLLAMLTAAAVLSLRAADFDATSAEALIAKNQQALVEINATITIKPELLEGPPALAGMLAGQKEQVQSVTAKGIIIQSDGLVAAPLAALDPTSLMTDGVELDTPLGKIKIGMKSTLSGVKIITADGQEYPAELLRSEPAAGLALVKANTPPAEGMPAIARVKELAAPLPFSRAFALTRLGAGFDRAPTVRVVRIVQATPPPVPLYDVAGPAAEPGSLVLDRNGAFIGMSVIPCRKQSGGILSASLFVLPATEIARLAAKFIP
ncbi:MAG: hypothetical protein WCK77_20055 [Verrucomicrobiota bacterium]